MRREKNYKTARLIEALEYIDVRFIEEAAEKIKPRPTSQAFYATGNRKKALRQILALAACVLLLSAAIPAITYITNHLPDIVAFFRGDQTTQTDPELTHPETPPVETTVPAPETTEIHHETTEEPWPSTTAPREDTTSPTEEVYDGSRGLEYWIIGTGYRARLVSIGTCTDTDVVVASTYNGSPVTEISAGAFAGGEKIESITLPDSITTIPAGAFAGCTNLKKLIIGAGVRNFNPTVLKDCPSLESIEISPENTTYSAVNGCIITKNTKTLVSALASAEIPSDGSVEIIAAGAIANLRNLTSLVIPEGVKTIKAGAIANCPELETVALPASLETFEEGALVGCPKLSSLSASDDGNYVVKGNCLVNIPLKRLILGFSTSVIPDDLGIVYIGRSAFEGSGIKSIDIPDSVTTIEESAFRGCTALSSVRFSAKLSTIGEYAFSGCTALEKIEFPQQLRTIGKYAFSGCSALTSLEIGRYTRTIHEAAFKDCTAIKNLVINVVSGSEKSFGKSVFEGCTALESAEIAGDGLISYSDATFKNCTSLKSFKLIETYYYVPAEMFYGCTSLEEVEFADNLSEIRENAFYGCTALKSVTVGESLQKIQENAFYGCRSLGKFVYLGNSTDWQGITKAANWRDGALFTAVKCSDKEIGVNDPLNHNGAPGLVHVMNADGKSATLTDLGKWWYSNGSKFADTYNGVPVTHIAPDVFRGKTNVVQKITLPQNLVEICDEQFIYCNRLTSVTIPATVSEIGTDAFRGCIYLETVTFKGTREQWQQIKLGENWNIGCNFTTVTCSDGTLTVDVPAEVNDGTPGLYYGISNEGYAYLRGMDQNCTEAEIKIATEYKGYKVTRIYERALQNKAHIESVIIPEGITSIGEYAFHNCPSLKSVKLPESLLSIGDYAFGYCPALKSIELPENLTSLRGDAFYGTSIKKLYIPKTVTELYWISCETLVTLEIHPDNPRYRCVGNCFIDMETKTLLQVFGKPTFPTDGSIEVFGEGVLWGNEEITELIIPEGVTHLWNNAIGDNPNLKKLHIPSTLVEIDYPIESYFDLRNLEVITVAPGNKTYYAKDNCLIEKSTENLILGNKYGKMPTDGSIKSIGYGAFAGLSIKSIVIPEGVVTIGSSAFSGCTSLENISFPKSLESIGSHAFGSCTALRNIKIDDNVKDFGIEVFAGCTLLENVTLPEKVEDWGWGMFDGCKNLKKITLPEGMGIGGISFASCTNLVDVTLPNDIAEISNYAFYGCTALKTLRIPESVTIIGDSAFRGCTSLQTLTLPSGVTQIRTNAFYGCASLRSINIPAGVTKIDRQAFYRCTSLERISLHSGVTSIGYMAFKECRSLSDFVYEGNLSAWNSIYKGSNWNTDSAILSVKCSDGSTPKKERTDYSDLSSLPEAYRKVLLNEVAYYNVTLGTEIYLDDTETVNLYSYQSGNFSHSEYAGYAVVDLDGDGKLEVLITSHIPGEDQSYADPGDKLILREYEGVVYGYLFDEAVASDFRTDGTFDYRSSGRNTGYSTTSRLVFSQSGYSVITYCKYRLGSNEYYIGTNSVTYEEYSEYRAGFAYDYLTWYPIDRYPIK